MTHHRAPSDRGTLSTLLFPVLLLPLVAAPVCPGQDAPRAEEPEFQADSAGKLACSARRFGKEHEYFVMLRIEVKNRSRFWSDPMSFDIGPGTKDKKEDFTVTVFRAPQPHMRRFGRGIPPGGKQTYMVQFPFYKAPKQFRAVVRNAVFYQGAALPKPDLQVGRLQHDHYETQGQRHPLTRCKVKNNTGRPIDAVFLADFTAPVDGRTLLRVHLEAGEEKAWEIREQQTAMQGSHGSMSGARVTKLQLVDWTTALPIDPKAGQEMFRQAYLGWVRWPDERPVLEARFRWRLEESDGKKVSQRSASGRITVDAAGRVDVHGDDKTSSNDRSAASLDVQTMFEDFLRPDVDFVLKHNVLQQMDSEWLQIKGCGLTRQTSIDPAHAWRLQFRARDGRFVATRRSLDNPIVHLQLQEDASGYVVTERTSGDAILNRERWTYERVGDQIVPVALLSRRDVKATGSTEERLLALSDVRWTGAVAAGTGSGKPAPPGGDGVAELRAAWNKPYNYGAAKKVTLQARIECKNPGTDLVWRGLRRVTGKVTFHGFRGFLVGRGWERIDVSLDQKLDEDQAAGVKAAVRGRLTMWGSRDITGRDEFDVVFAGAKIQKSATAERFEIEGPGRYKAVGVSNGMPAWVEYRRGGRRSFRYQQLGEAWVSVETRAGKEQVTAKWREVDGWLLPVEVRLERALGDDWGPEQLKLGSVKIDP